jgi:putative phosphoesterase
MKIGVVSDSHIPESGPLLHARLAKLFQGLDILLHAGDVCELHVLEDLQEMFTLTFAVWGEGDSDEVRRYLEEKRVVRFGGRAIGMIHGHQYAEAQKRANRWLNRLLKRVPGPGTLEDFLLAQFEGEEVDAIVFGHTHTPYIKRHKGVLLFNPGAGSSLAGPDRQASAGILEVEEDDIYGRIRYL